MIMNLISISVANLMVLFFVSTTVLADVKVLVIPKGSKAAFWGKVCEGAQQAGVDLAIRVTLRGPYTEDQHTAQIEIIEYGIRQNYNAIVLASTHARERVKSQYPQVNVIADPYMGASVGSAYRIMLNFIDRFSTIDAIISVGEEATLGILRALESRGLQGKIKLIGFDFNTTIGNAILNHEMDATIAQNPFQIGYLGMKTACQLIQNEAVPPKIYTDTTLITTKNYQTPNVQTIINSNISQWELQKELR